MDNLPETRAATWEMNPGFIPICQYNTAGFFK